MSGESRTGRAAQAAALMLATLMLGGCALGMLNGAANSGGSPAAGSASPASQPSAARTAADSTISTSVRSKLAANPALKPFNLRVDTHDGRVTLRGQVANVDQRNAAQLDARAVKGVTSVQNLITVR
jgi:osmotically-inducible protein OsmY